MVRAFEALKAQRDGRIERRPATRAAARRLEGLKLTKRYAACAVVDRVVIRVEAGEVIGLLGLNGAGKTITFYLLAGLVRPDKGRVMLSGKESTYLPLYKRAIQGISYLTRELSVFRRLTVEQILLAVLDTLPLSR